MLQFAEKPVWTAGEGVDGANSPLTYGQVLVQDGRRWLTFSNPLYVFVAYEAHEVAPAMREIDKAVSRQGLYAAGFMAYEAAAAYDLAVHKSAADGLPLLWFGLYEQPSQSGSGPQIDRADARYYLGQWRTSLEEEAYTKAVHKIKDRIASGDTYQVNFTMHLQTLFSGDPRALFFDLVQAQRADYTAYLDLGKHVICSASPELFFRLQGNRLTARPMKGTAVRGRTLEEDRQQIAGLHASVKDRAENVMIVDMIRNDFGRIAEIGSVNVPYLFTVEKYPTLLQMTSTVTAQSAASLPELMEAMFPCASITGAPKVRTMQIINELEPEPRGLYTGTIGYFGPERQAQFNVAIRTVIIDRETGLADYGVGSGIVWDSDAAGEYEECRLKTEVLTRRRPSFDLLESLLWTPDEGYFLLDKHLQRLAGSAEYFDFSMDEQQVRLRLDQLTHNLSALHKVRLLLGEDGNITTQAVSLAGNRIIESVKVGLAEDAVDSSEVWLYHKTTHRQVYEKALASRPECDEVLLWNERGELCEATSSNIVLEIDGRLLTPPVSCGLLAGTFRQHLLEQGQIEEGIVTLADLEHCTQLFLINSVRCWRSAYFMDNSQRGK
jgi:para-aminobenzoate synthetase / 4-amino-4-deoxychorismate lyase